MNRVDRLMAMVVQLQSRRLVRAEEMAAHFEISVRTVYRDFAALSEAGIPIVAEAGVGYSLVKGYHLPPVMFTTEEASALSLSSKLVDHLTDASLSKSMSSALLKIRSVLPRDRQDYLDRLDQATLVVARGSATNPRFSSEALVPIQRSIVERRVVILEYRAKEKSDSTRRAVEPLGLVYYADNWHLIAFCRLRGEVRDFRTDRISKFEVSSEQFSPHEDFSLKGYLESCCECAQELACLRFKPAQLDRVRRESHFGVIEEKPDGDGVIVTMLAGCFEAFTGWILSFGDSAEVLAPKHLRDRVAGEALKVASRYEARRAGTLKHTEAA